MNGWDILVLSWLIGSVITFAIMFNASRERYKSRQDRMSDEWLRRYWQGRGW